MATASATEAILTTRRRRVLVAEDNDEVRELVAWALRADGYDVIEARDGRAAIDYIASAMLFGEQDRAPDAIVTDVRMPGMTGTTLLAGLRARGWTTPVILMTAYDADAIARDATSIGADAVFAKPFDVEELRTTVARVLVLGARAPAKDER